MLRVTCPHCGHSAKANERFAGRKTKCRGCGNLLRFPRAKSRNATKSDVPIIKSFEIKKTLLGKYVASYECLRCKSALRSSECELLRGDDTCPRCEQRFRVAENAVAEIEARRREQQEEKQRKQVQRHQARVQAKREADAKFYEQLQAKKEQRERRRELYSRVVEEKAGKNASDRVDGPDAPVRCPRCKSTQVHAEKRGYDFWRGGVLGSRKIIITCVKCGCQFKPGEGL